MLCPKCRRPIEGPEEYICCGSEVLDWRCRACSKVSQGFAFPYGRCPRCAGELELAAPAGAAGDAALSALRAAFEIELGGRAFYAEAARKATDPDLADLFGRLADMEDEHLAILERRYHAATNGTTSGSAVDRAALYAGVGDHGGDPARLLDIAIACECRAAAFFAAEACRLPEGSDAGRLCRELAAEEREHADLLAAERDRRLAGKAGIL